MEDKRIEKGRRRKMIEVGRGKPDKKRTEEGLNPRRIQNRSIYLYDFLKLCMQPRQRILHYAIQLTHPTKAELYPVSSRYQTHTQ